jgi:hypothetical protein
MSWLARLFCRIFHANHYRYSHWGLRHWNITFPKCNRTWVEED